jgi:molybdopterin synthase catalytic subunit
MANEHVSENVQIRPAPFDPWQLTQQFQEHRLNHGEYGATASFVGTMRDFNENDDVQAMTLEHYPGMTESQLQAIIDDAHQQWPLLQSLIVHRVGDIAPGDPIVLVVCWSAHRAAAFDACRYLMEALKSRAPFWKKETLADNTERWVEKNTDGYSPGSSSGS